MITAVTADCIGKQVYLTLVVEDIGEYSLLVSIADWDLIRNEIKDSSGIALPAINSFGKFEEHSFSSDTNLN